MEELQLPQAQACTGKALQQMQQRNSDAMTISMQRKVVLIREMPCWSRILAVLANSGDGQMMARPDSREADHWHGHDSSQGSPETDIAESSMSWPINSFTMRQNTLYESLKDEVEEPLAAQCMQQSVPEAADDCEQQPEKNRSTQDRNIDPCSSLKASVSAPSIDGCAAATAAPAQEGGEKQVEPIAIYDGETKVSAHFGGKRFLHAVLLDDELISYEN